MDLTRKIHKFFALWADKAQFRDNQKDKQRL